MSATEHQTGQLATTPGNVSNPMVYIVAQFVIVLYGRTVDGACLMHFSCCLVYCTFVLT